MNFRNKMYQYGFFFFFKLKSYSSLGKWFISLGKIFGKNLRDAGKILVATDSEEMIMDIYKLAQ